MTEKESMKNAARAVALMFGEIQKTLNEEYGFNTAMSIAIANSLTVCVCRPGPATEKEGIPDTIDEFLRKLGIDKR